MSLISTVITPSLSQSMANACQVFDLNHINVCYNPPGTSGAGWYFFIHFKGPDGKSIVKISSHFPRWQDALADGLRQAPPSPAELAAEEADYRREVAEDEALVASWEENSMKAIDHTVQRDTHRGWLIEQNWMGEWEATHPDYDPTPTHLYDGPSDNRRVLAETRDGVIEEIDIWIEENEDD